MTWQTIAALIEPLEVGTTFSRRAWPPHVTLAPNFRVDAPLAAVERMLREASADEPPLGFRFGDEALFGPASDVPVQLVESDRIVDLHHGLLRAARLLPGFAEQEPQFWGAGYRPHLTHAPGISPVRGARGELSHLVIADLTGSRATITAALSLRRV